MGYVYLHKNPKTNEVFYVGLGGFSKSESNFARAYKLTQRNKHHINYVNKHGCLVEIFKTNLTFEEASLLEKELINKFDTYKTGCNQTLGGDGTLGYIHTLETKKKVSKASRDRFSNPQWKSKFMDNQKKVDYSKVANSSLISRGNKIFTVWRAIIIKRGTYVKGECLGIFLNKSECARYLGFGEKGTSKLDRCLKGGSKIAYGYIFEFGDGRE